MALVKIRVPRTSQPQDACGIDWDNPLTINLAGVRTGNELYGSTGGTVTVGPSGLQISGVTVKFPLGEVPTSAGVTLFQLATFNAINNVSSGNICTASSDGFGFKNNTTSLRLLTDAGGTNTAIVSSKTLTIGVELAACGTYDGTTQRLYENGLQTASGSKTGALDLGANPTLNLGANFNVGTFNGSCSLLLYYTRALSAPEVRSLSENPWQIFEPEELTIWIPDTASAPLDNLTPKNITIGSVVISVPTVGQSHILLKNDVNLSSITVSPGSIQQVHNLDTKDVVTESLTISKPTLSYEPILVNLIGKGISLGAFTTSNPVVGQVHLLVPQVANISFVEISKPALSSASNTDNLTNKSIALEALQVTKPSINQIHVLIGLDVTLDELSIAKSAIGQIHVLAVQPVTFSTVVISKPELTSLASTDVLSPKDINLSVVTVSNPAITQVHTLVGRALVTGSVSIVKPIFRQVNGLTPKGIDLPSLSISKPILTSGVVVGVYPLPEQVLIGITYGPTGTEYTGTLVVGTGATVYIEQILSEVVDDKIIVLLQDEVIQSNILSETT